MVKTNEIRRHALQLTCLYSSLFILPAMGLQGAFAQQTVAQQNGIMVRSLMNKVSLLLGQASWWLVVTLAKVLSRIWMVSSMST